MAARTPLTVNIADDEIVIRLGLDAFKFVVEYGPTAESLDPEVEKLVVTDARTFADAVVYWLGKERGDGLSLAAEAIDLAIDKAVDDGAEGIVFAPPPAPAAADER